MEKWNITSRYHCWPVVAVALMCPLSTLLEQSYICYWSLKKKKTKRKNRIFKAPWLLQYMMYQKYQHREIYYQRNIITGQQNTSGPFIQSKLLTKKKINTSYFISGSDPLFAFRTALTAPIVHLVQQQPIWEGLESAPEFVSFVLWWGQEQCSLPRLLS